jgi:hypothetical protein
MAAETASGPAATHAPAGPDAAGIRAQAGAVARRSVTRTLRQRRLLILPVAFPLILFAINGSSLASASRLQGFPPVSYRAFALAVPFLLWPRTSSQDSSTGLPSRRCARVPCSPASSAAPSLSRPSRPSSTWPSASPPASGSQPAPWALSCSWPCPS